MNSEWNLVKINELKECKSEISITLEHNKFK